MQTLSDTLTNNITARVSLKETFDWQLFVSISALIVCGSFTYAIYPPPVNAAAFGLMVGFFYYNLHKQDLVSFFIQLLIGNFFVYGLKFGGNYNLSAFAAIVFYTAINGKITFLQSSILDMAVKTALSIWCVFAFISTFGGNVFPFDIEIQNFFAFGLMLFTFFFATRVRFTEDDFYKFIITISIFSGYEFLVAVNQKYVLYNSPFPFFPTIDASIEFYMGIVRSVSTLNNFEAFAEFSMSLITLLLPGILSGTALKKSKSFYYLSLVTIVLCALSIVLSGTRSSILLLPFSFLTICLFLGRRLKIRLIIFMAFTMAVLFAANSQFKLIDLDVFSERSEGLEVDQITLSSMLNGESMNRGGLFPYAFEQVKKTGIVGRGYFVTGNEYRAVHFKKGEMDDGIADYHNLYMSSYVMFGAIGCIAMMFIFFYSLARGWRTFWQLRRKDHFLLDLLLGFNVLFFYFLINQFKIQFIRDINYFTIIMLLLSLYISLTWLLRQDAFIKRMDENKHIVL